MKNQPGPIGRPAGWRPPRQLGRLAAVLAAAVVFAAACSSGSSQQAQALGRVLTRCMRTHGFAGFPDSAVTLSDGQMNITVTGAGVLYPKSPALHAAFRVCQVAVDRADAQTPNAG